MFKIEHQPFRPGEHRRYTNLLRSQYKHAQTMTAIASFESLPWLQVSEGAREKRIVRGTAVLRLLEFSPPFVEPDWCEKSHVGYVVDGGFSIRFHDRTETFVAGDGLLLSGGSLHAHKAIVDRTVLLFLVETVAQE